MQQDAASLTHRVRRLEQLTAALSAAVILLVGLLVIAARPEGQSRDTLQVRRLQLVDHVGRVRMDLRHDSTETGLFVLDEAGDMRVGVAQFAHGGGGFALHGPRMKGAAVLYLKDAGSLSVYDTSGAVTARFPGTADSLPREGS